MLFSSMEFLFFFFPGVLVGYFLLRGRARNVWLLAASLFFYAWGEPTFLLALLASIGFNYILALSIAAAPPERVGRRLLLALAVAGNIGFLFTLKYMNFITDALKPWFPQVGGLFGGAEFVMPIGISFFTFQALSYVIDVYRGTPPQRNLLYLGLYISFFPQLIAGPIVRYTTVADQIDHRTITLNSFAEGMLRFLRGFSKKVLLANTLAVVADEAFTTTEPTVALAWLGIICYTLQIFFDFSGYSEMAIGLGRMFGFTFPENFNYPYISKTVTEFWRRWHISLGTWFRDYLYFPLGGSRVKSKARLAFNLLIVWTLTGIWHGAGVNFIVWGFGYGIIILFEKLLSLPKRLPEHRLCVVVYQIFTLLAVMLGWVLFRARTLSDALAYLRTMFGLSSAPLTNGTFRLYLHDYIAFLIMGLLCSTPLFKRLRETLSARGSLAASFCEVGVCLIQMALFAISISYLVIQAHNPFIYFNF